MFFSDKVVNYCYNETIFCFYGATMKLRERAQALLRKISTCKTIAEVENLNTEFLEMKDEHRKLKEQSTLSDESNPEDMFLAIEQELASKSKRIRLQTLFDDNIQIHKKHLVVLEERIVSSEMNAKNLEQLNGAFANIKANIELISGLSDEKKKSFETQLNKIDALLLIKLNRQGELEYVMKNIEALETKLDRFKKLPDQQACEVADTLCKAIKDYSKQYGNGQLTKEDFKTKSQDAITVARDNGVLSKHRGCKQILLNLAFAIVTLGLGYVAAALIRHTFSPLKVGTDSSKRLHSLDEQLDSLTPKKG